VVNSTSSGVISRASPVSTPHQKNWAWGQITPLDGPLVPEVNRMAAVSPGCASWAATGAPDAGTGPASRP